MLIKAKSLIKLTATQMKVDEELASDVIDFYYATLRKKMSSLQYSRIRVVGIGVFYVSKKKLNHSINTLISMLRDESPNNFKKLARLKINNELVEKQKVLFNKIEEEENEVRCKKDMAKQKADSGGNQE